jgi:hypothetical protein
MLLTVMLIGMIGAGIDSAIQQMRGQPEDGGQVGGEVQQGRGPGRAQALRRGEHSGCAQKPAQTRPKPSETPSKPLKTLVKLKLWLSFLNIIQI